MAQRILGRRYELSLVICGDTLARKVNKKYRKKDYAPNVLSFPIAKNEGEIFLNADKAGREAGLFHISHRARLAHLFVHGCYHLKGHKHGERMDRAEKMVLQQFKIK
jgi:probable rRNA maturation factor